MTRTRPDFTAADHDGLDLRTLHALPTAHVCEDCDEPATKRDAVGVPLDTEHEGEIENESPL